MRTRIAGVAMAASLLGGAGAVVLATTPMAAFADEVAPGATAEAKTPARWATSALKGLVDKGTINQEQSDAVAKALQEARPEARSEGGHRGGGHKGGGHHLSLTKAAEVIGISETDLKTALGENKSLATIAKDRNVDVQKVIDALVAEQNTRLDESVKAGKLTQAQADERKAKTVERVTAMVNNVRTKSEPGRGGPGFERGNDSAASQTST